MSTIPTEVAALWGLGPADVSKVVTPRKIHKSARGQACYSNTGYKHITWAACKNAFNVVMKESPLTGEKVSTSRVTFSAALAIRNLHAPEAHKLDTFEGEHYAKTQRDR